MTAATGATPTPGHRRPARRRFDRRLGRTAAVVVGAGILALGAGACGDSNPGPPVPDVNDPDAPPATAPNGAPSFPLPEDPGAQIRASGLRELPDDVELVTTYAHVDVFINDFVVDVPAGIGVTPGGSSPLNTPADDGVVRMQVEAEDAAGDDPPVYTLGQLFTQWGVRLDKSCVATYCTNETNQLLGIVNGQLVGDPASIAFADGDQIVVWYGPRGTNPPVPVSHDFPPSSTR